MMAQLPRWAWAYAQECHVIFIAAVQLYSAKQTHDAERLGRARAVGRPQLPSPLGSSSRHRPGSYSDPSPPCGGPARPRPDVPTTRRRCRIQIISQLSNEAARSLVLSAVRDRQL